MYSLSTGGGTKGILAKVLAKALLELLSTDEVMSGVILSELAKAESLNLDDHFLVGTSSGNKSLTPSDLYYELIDTVIASDQKRNFWRGKDLGSVYTDAQKVEVRNGTFHGLFLGDYWNIGDRIWRIMDFNYWFNTGVGSNICRENHLVIVPDRVLYNEKMHTSPTTTEGYLGTMMHRSGGLSPAISTIKAAFGEASILIHSEVFSNVVTNGMVTGVAESSPGVTLLNEYMLYGSLIMASATSNNVSTRNQTESMSQLAGFNINRRKIYEGASTYFWLRDVVDNKCFTVCGGSGRSDSLIANLTAGVRPVFGIKG